MTCLHGFPLPRGTTDRPLTLWILDQVQNDGKGRGNAATFYKGLYQAETCAENHLRNAYHVAYEGNSFMLH